MGTGRIVLALLSAVVMCLGGLDAYYYYRTYDLNDYCGSTIILPCGHTAPYRAGTLKFVTYPTRNCTITVTLQDTDYCYPDFENYAIYFNVREVSFYNGDSVTIKENSTYYPYSSNVMKTYSGQPVASVAPTSVDQFMTQSSRTPKFTITFTKVYTAAALNTNSISLDYNVVHGSSNAVADSYCPALSGYVQDELICETSDRVNCPYSYATFTFMYPATSKDQGTQTVCYSMGTTYRPYTYRPYTYRPSYDYYDDMGIIVGAVFGSIVGFILIVGLISLACRNRTHRVVHRHTTGVSVPVHNQHSAYGPSVVVSSYPGYTTQPPTFNGSFAGPPPAYEHVVSAPSGQFPGPASVSVMQESPNC